MENSILRDNASTIDPQIRTRMRNFHGSAKFASDKSTVQRNYYMFSAAVVLRTTKRVASSLCMDTVTVYVCLCQLLRKLFIWPVACLRAAHAALKTIELCNDDQ